MSNELPSFAREASIIAFKNLKTGRTLFRKSTDYTDVSGSKFNAATSLLSLPEIG